MYTVKKTGESELAGLYYNGALICVFVSYKHGEEQAEAIAALLNLNEKFHEMDS